MSPAPAPHVWLDPEHNPEVDALLEEHNRLTDAFNSLNARILGVHIPGDPGQETVEITQELEQDANALQHEMIDFESRAKQFVIRPSMTITSTEPLNRSALYHMHLQNHMVQVILLLRYDIINSRLLLGNNLWSVIQEAQTRRSVKMATDANFLAALGIILGLFALCATIALAN